MSNIYRRDKMWWGCAVRQGRKYRRSLKTANREIAERRLRQWLSELEAIAWGDKPRRTFEETTERFVRDHLTTLKPRGAERYFTSLKQLAAYFDGKTLDQIKSAQLSEFESKRRGDVRLPERSAVIWPVCLRCLPQRSTGNGSMTVRTQFRPISGGEPSAV